MIFWLGSTRFLEAVLFALELEAESFLAALLWASLALAFSNSDLPVLLEAALCSAWLLTFSEAVDTVAVFEEPSGSEARTTSAAASGSALPSEATNLRMRGCTYSQFSDWLCEAKTRELSPTE